MHVGSRALVTLRHSLAHFDQIRIILGLILVKPEWRWFLKNKFFIWKYEIIFGYPFESCTHGRNCEWRRVVLGPFFSHIRVILGPSLTRPEWSVFGRNEIMGLKIQNNFLICIWEIPVGSRVLVTLRYSFAHFDQIRIVLGMISVNPGWRWFLKRKILHLQIWNDIWIPFWEL